MHLREALRPPPGFALSRAIATTFTLDLASALVAPLAFAAHEIDQDKDPVAVMEAIRSVTDRVDIFCQAGNIAVPRNVSDLMAFLEPMVHELPRPSGHLFHPKVWLLRYEASDGSVQFRLVCGSRNLTPDTAWDAAVSLDGKPGPGADPRNDPITALVRHVSAGARRIPESRREAMASFGEELAFAEWDRPDQVNEVVFHALGVGSRTGAISPIDFTGRRHLVVAPFVEDGGLTIITAGSSDVAVVARAEQLERLTPATLAAVQHTYCVSSMAELGDPDDLSTSGPANLHGLHAKIIGIERGRQAHLFIGSANATSAALGGNVEFVVELIGAVKHFGIDALIGDESGFRSIIEPYTAVGGELPPDSEELGKRLENFLRSVAEKEFVVRPAPDAEGTYDLEVTGPSLSIEDRWAMTVAPLNTPNAGSVVANGVPVELWFAKLDLADVGPFLVVRVESSNVERSTVIRATLLNDPPDRLDAVLARQVDTPEKLMRFLMLVLGLGAFDIEGMAPPGSGGSGWSFGGGTALFELVVRAVAERPEALLQIDRLLIRMQQTDKGRALLPDGLMQLWEAVRPLLPIREAIPA